MSASTKRAEARIEQLCCLGLGAQAIMPALLKALHTLVPSYANAFYWTDEDNWINNLYFEDPCTVAWLYSVDFYDRRKSELAIDLSRSPHCVQQAQGVANTRCTHPKLLTPHLDDPIYRPLNRYSYIRFFARDYHRVWGTLQLCRLKGETKFSAREQHLQTAAAPFIATGLVSSADFEVPLANSEESGLLVIDKDGKLDQLSPMARKLLLLAIYPRISPATVCCSTGTAAPTELTQLCKKTCLYVRKPTGNRPLRGMGTPERLGQL
jgi:hypothetical protein